jgi:hypothetical protein
MAVGFPGMQAGYSCADARDVGKDFIDRVESIVAFYHNRRRRVARENVIQEIERPIGHWMGVSIR